MTSALGVCECLAPAELVHSLFIDAVVVRDLVDEGRVHFVAELFFCLADREVWFPVDDDSVGEFPEAVLAALGECDALVESEEIERPVLGAVLDLSLIHI